MKKAELVFVPAPARGHLIPSVEFAKRLVAQDDRLSITMLIMNQQIDPNLDSYIDSLLSSSSERIKFVKFSQTPKPPEAAHPMVAIDLFFESYKPLVKQVVAELVIQSNATPDSPRLAGFVIDMLTTTMIDVANDFGVPTYVFFTGGAGYLGLKLHAITHDKDSTEFMNDPEAELIVPSFRNPVPAGVYPGELLEKTTRSIIIKYARRMFGETKGIVANTFMELESHALHSLSEASGKHHPPVYSVGPLLNLTHSRTIEWLDDQPPLSVVFLCFGSAGAMQEEQVKEIACALEHSKLRFLWSLRQPPQRSDGFNFPNDYEDPKQILPEGFLDRTARIGKVISWSSQVDVLAHPSIGGFVSHCGWNSVLESIWFGVPIATWPLYSEQQLNAFEIVKELRLAVEIKNDYRGGAFNSGMGDEVITVRAKEIETSLKKLMERDSEIRDRVKEMSEKSRKTMKDGGSSHSSLASFIYNVMDNFAIMYG